MRNTGKKTAIVLTVLLAGVMMTGCGNTAKDDSASTTTETTQDAEATEEAEPTEEAAKMLVVYFSATGSTKAVAGYIAESPPMEI